MRESRSLRRFSLSESARSAERSEGDVKSHLLENVNAPVIAEQGPVGCRTILNLRPSRLTIPCSIRATGFLGSQAVETLDHALAVGRGHETEKVGADSLVRAETDMHREGAVGGIDRKVGPRRAG